MFKNLKFELDILSGLKESDWSGRLISNVLIKVIPIKPC